MVWKALLERREVTMTQCGHKAGQDPILQRGRLQSPESPGAESHTGLKGQPRSSHQPIAGEPFLPFQRLILNTALRWFI